MLLRFFEGRKNRGGDRRQFARVPVRAGRILIDGTEYELVDWSIKGFLISGYSGPLQRDEVFVLEISVPERSDRIAFEAKAQVVRRDAVKGHLAGVFTELSPEARRKIAEYGNIRLRAQIG